MAATITLPNGKTVLAGCGWQILPGLTGRAGEVRQAGRSVSDAAWQYVWTTKSEAAVAFVTKGEAAKCPVAAVALLQQQITVPTFLVLLNVGMGRFWCCGVLDGLPSVGMDVVEGDVEALAVARDFLSMLDKPEEIPVLTDCAELLADTPWNLTLQDFSLQTLVEKSSVSAWRKARFQRYSSLPPYVSVVLGVLVLGVAGWWFYDDMIETAKRATMTRQAREAERQAQILKARKLEDGINAAPILSQVTRHYWSLLQNLPLMIAGWQLKTVNCSGKECVLMFSAPPLATWDGYLAAKPAHWPAPKIGVDINKVEQSLNVQWDALPTRKLDSLPTMQTLVLAVGNLAQRVRLTGISLSLETRGKPVGEEKENGPVKVGFSMSGPLPVMSGMAERLPPAVGLSSLSVRLDAMGGKFDMKGEAYAKP